MTVTGLGPRLAAIAPVPQPPLAPAATPIPPAAISFVTPPTLYQAGTSPGYTAFADLNGDGKQDLVVSNSAGIAIMLGRGDGTFQTAVEDALSSSGGITVATDVNGDGRIDLVVGQGSSFAVLLGNGDATFQAPILVQSYGGIGGIAVGDLNGDGKLDVVTGDAVLGGYCTVFLGNGDGTFGAPSTVGPLVSNRRVYGVSLADFNGDGRLDLAAADGGDTMADPVGFQVMMGNGDGTFGTPVWYRTGNTYQSDDQALIGDFNGDGHPDIAGVDFGCGYGDGDVVVYLNNGAGGFNESADLGDGCLKGYSAVVDMNGDQEKDIVTINGDTPYDNNAFVRVFVGNGNGTFQSAVVTSLSPAYSATALGVADLNADGLPDIATANNGSGNVGVLINNSPVPPIGGAIGPLEHDGVPYCEHCINRARRIYDQPVNSATGDFYHTFIDMAISGRGIPLTMTHTYNSNEAGTNGPLGFGWTFPYNMGLSINGTTGVLTLTEEGGSQVTFTLSGGAYTAPPRVFATLVKNADGTFTLTRNARERDTFSATGRLTALQDLNGYVTSLGYNAGGQLSSVTEPAGRAFAVAWSGSHIASVSDPTGRQVQFQYNDGAGNLTDVLDVNGGLTHFTYDANHLLMTMTDPRNGVVTNHYDASNRVDYQLDQLNRKTTFQYTTSGPSLATTITDPKGNATVDYYIYGELVQETRAYGTTSAATTSYTYDPATVGQTVVTDPNGHTWHMSYDSHGNLLTRTDPLNRTTTNTYDGLNDLLTTTDPLNVMTTNSYDAAGNLLSTARPLVESSPAQTQVTSYTHGDSAHPGDVTSMKDPSNYTWAYTYDSYGNRTSVADPRSDLSTYTYNTVGWLTASVTPKGNLYPNNPADYTTSYSYADPQTGGLDPV